MLLIVSPPRKTLLIASPQKDAVQSGKKAPRKG